EELGRDVGDRRRTLAGAEDLRMRTRVQDVRLPRERPEARPRREYAIVDFLVKRDRPLATERAERAFADLRRQRPEHRVAESDLVDGQLFPRLHRETMRRWCRSVKDGMISAPACRSSSSASTSRGNRSGRSTGSFAPRAFASAT